MAFTLRPEVRRFLITHRVARLATADALGRPSVVPICYAFDGRRFYSAIDDKPKGTRWQRLRRVRNIEVNSRVALVIDDYDDDWRRLRFAVVRGRARVVDPDGRLAPEHRRAVVLLRNKYPQYRSMAIGERPLIRIVASRVVFWSPAGVARRKPTRSAASP
jgi:PPOX class probable F420-dependent enzyme